MAGRAVAWWPRPTDPRRLVHACRYGPYMALLQVRDVPEDAYELIRRRAPANGQSMQGYLLGLVVAHARRPTPEEVLAELDEDFTASPPVELDTADLVADLETQRARR